MYQSLRCGLAAAARREQPQPDWELAAARLGHVLAAHPERFADRERFAMDWYYPVLAGVCRADDGLARIDGSWARFVVPRLGVRCVDDRPWVTGAESSELALALWAVGDERRAAEILSDIQFLRADDGAYRTGWVFPDRTFWPVEQTSWTSGAVLLAAAALAGDPATTGVFGGSGLPGGGCEPALIADESYVCPAQHP
jgi:hypothetical protein